MGRNITTGTKAKKKRTTPDKKKKPTRKKILIKKNSPYRGQILTVKKTLLKKKALPKKTVQDSVFTDLFSIKKYILELYKTLHPEDKDITEDDIEIVTINNVLLDQEYNDLGFRAKKITIVLIEAQSTWTVNILIRVVLYLAQTWKEHIVRTGQDIYKSKKVTLPRPEFYVVFTGERKKKPEFLTLSDHFFKEQGSDLNVRVRMLYGTGGDDIISQYVEFTKIYKEQYRKYGRNKKAVLETIRICKKRNILKEYLENREKEVTDIMTALFDEETILNAYLREASERAVRKAAKKAARKAKIKAEEMVRTAKKEAQARGMAEGIEQGIEQGMQQGIMQEKKETAMRMMKKGMSADVISDFVGVNINMVQEWVAGTLDEEK